MLKSQGSGSDASRVFLDTHPVVIADIHEGTWPLPGYNAIVYESLSDADKVAEFSSPGHGGHQYARKIDFSGSEGPQSSYSLIMGSLALKSYDAQWVAKFHVKSIKSDGCALELTAPDYNEKKMQAGQEGSWEEVVTDPFRLTATSKLEVAISCPTTNQETGGTFWLDDVRLYQVM